MVAAAGDVSSSAIPFSDGNGISAWFFIKVMCITVILLMAAYAALMFLKKRNLLPAARRDMVNGLRVVESYRLGPRTTLYVVRHGTELVLITESSHHVSTAISTVKADIEDGQGKGERG